MTAAELIPAGTRSDDEWELYIREADPAVAILERCERCFEFQTECKAKHGKQGGSRYAEFMRDRFGYSETTSSHLAIVGRETPKLCSNATKFAPDWTAFYDFTRLPAPAQQRLLESDALIDRKAVATERKAARIESRPAPPLASELAGAYSVLYADPPWRYEHVKTESRAIENQYPTMALDEICALEVPAADDAILFLWATAPKLYEAMRVLDAWGFTYRTCSVWDKQKIGMGYYFRQQHELLLVATRGTFPAPPESTRESSVYREKRGEHSAKPDYYAELIERMYPAHARVELFARAPRDGWSVWGNEAA